MALQSGTRLGSYEVVGLLGVGGMGEVYRARDTRLQRDVALKVLPDIAAADPDRRERFKREALAVAALNHPHIVTIHSVEEAGTTFFLTMELVEGRSLAEVLPAGGLTLDRVLTIGIAVSEAVSAAHQKGITHRDLKPANIMLGEGEQLGRIKVLDFGLAKIVEPHGATAASMVPTEAAVPAAPTADGRILGTVAYMSPEQAEGRAIDGRSDVFSLGVMLYEMATGQRPFTGDTSLSILSSILRDTPRSITDINPALPRDLGRIIRRALAKDPERRYQSAKDLRNDLEDLKASLDSGELSTQPTTAPATSTAASVQAVSSAAPAPSSDAQLVVALVRKHSRALGAVVVVLAVVAAALVALYRRDAQPASNEQPATSSFADQVTPLTTSGNAERPAISPDGQYVTYVQRTGDTASLRIRQTATTNDVEKVAPKPGVTLWGATFTPDGTSIDFVAQPADAPADVWRVPVVGGTPKPLILDVSSGIGWAPDSQRMAFLRTRRTPLTTQLIVAAPNGGQEHVLASSTADRQIVQLRAPWHPIIPPAWSPDGRVIAVSTARPDRQVGGVLFVDSQTGSTQEVTAPMAAGLGWLDPQALVINAAITHAPRQLFRLTYPAGSMTRVTNDPNHYEGISLTGDRSSLVTGRRDAWMDVWVADGGAATGTDVVQRVPVSVAGLAWSADQLLYSAVVSGRPAILRLTLGEGTSEDFLVDAVWPAATSDGGTIVFLSSEGHLWTADASGRPITRISTKGSDSAIVIANDRFVLYRSVVGGSVSIWMVPIGGGEPRMVTDGGSVTVSPDGQSIAFTTLPADGRSSLVTCVLPDCSSRHEIGVAPAEAPLAWTPKGDGVAYARDGNVWVQPLSKEAPRQLTRFTDNRSIGPFAWSRDGKHLAITRLTISNDIVLFRGLK